MLVLSRRAAEEICIGSQIRVRILKVSGNTVRLGIEAPAATPILRAELSARLLNDSDTAALPADCLPEQRESTTLKGVVS